MVKQITKAQFIALYENENVREVFSVQVGTEQRIYGKTDIQVVYCVV